MKSIATYGPAFLGYNNSVLARVCNGEVSKSAKIWLSKSIFYVKNHLNLSYFITTVTINIPKGKYWILRIGLMGRCQKVPKFYFQSQFSTSKIIWIFFLFFSFSLGGSKKLPNTLILMFHNLTFFICPDVITLTCLL